MTDRITAFIGYSAETSAPNERPQWGHFTATWADAAQERFEKWLADHDAALIESLAEGLDTAPYEEIPHGSPIRHYYEAWIRSYAQQIREGGN